MSIYYELAGDGVIWEKIGDQIVMANLSSGQYCNISEKSGTLVWELITQGASLDDVERYLTLYFRDYNKEHSKKIQEYLTKLVKLNFILILNERDSKKHTSIETYAHDKNLQEVFTEPKILFYDDIDTLLQLDPIDDHVEELMKEYQS